MIRVLPNGRDKSGQSGQPRKHWCLSVPSQFLCLGRTRDSNPSAASTVTFSKLTLTLRTGNQCHSPQGRKA
jgi:hypothetical protein